MKIAAIITEFNKELDIQTWGGIARHNNELRKGFYRGKDHNYITSLIYAGDRLREHPKYKNSRFTSKLLKSDKYRLEYKEKLISALSTYASEKPSIIYHHLNSFELPQPWLLKIAQDFNVVLVTSIIDFQEQDFPEFLGHEVKKKRNQNYEVTLKCAKRLITASAFICEDAANYFGICKQDTVHIPLGSNHIDSELPSKTHSVKHLTDSTSSYFLFPAKDWPNKGHIDLLKAIDKVNLQARVIFTGNLDKLKKEIGLLKLREDTKKKIEFLGFVGSADLYGLMLQSNGVFFSSHYEGFGFPYFEAARLKKPIIAFSNKVTLEYFNDEAGYFVERGNFERLIEAANTSLIDEKVDEKIEKAYLVSKDLNWENTAESTMKVFQDVINCY